MLIACPYKGVPFGSEGGILQACARIDRFKDIAVTGPLPVPESRPWQELIMPPSSHTHSPHLI